MTGRSPVSGRGGDQRIPRPSGSRAGPPPSWSGVVTGPTLEQVRGCFVGWERRPDPPTSQARSSAVLVPLYELDGEVWVVLTRRAAHLRAHQGEVSFPGGGREGDEDLVTTALREAHEEVALDASTVEVIGELDTLSTVTSRSSIVPFVGVLPGRPDDLVANPDEVAHIIHVRLAELLAEEVYREELWAFDGSERSMFFFELHGDTVWGATASMLQRLLALVTDPGPR